MGQPPLTPSHSGSSEQFFLCFLFELLGHIEGKTWRERVEGMQHNTTEVYFGDIYKHQMVFHAHESMSGFVGLVFCWLSWMLRSTSTWLIILTCFEVAVTGADHRPRQWYWRRVISLSTGATAGRSSIEFNLFQFHQERCEVDLGRLRGNSRERYWRD